MFDNPFTPIFGGKPDLFFGRKDILARFDLALVDRGSEDRSLLITGNRRCGKTALLEQLSSRAARRGWKTIDLGPDNLTQALLRRLVRHSEETRTVDPSVSVSVLGTGGSIGGVASSKTTHYEASDLDLVLLEACEKGGSGVFVSIDEVQKASLEEVAAVCGAFQMASRKGHDVILALAGLPYAYDDVIKHEGCTFMRRSAHVSLGLLGWSEALGAFEGTFARIEGLELGGEVAKDLARASYGHPYLIQLLGHEIIGIANKRTTGRRYMVDETDVCDAARVARAAFERRAVKPMVEELSPSEREYLAAMALSLDENRIARSGSVSQELGKEQRQVSVARASLLRSGTIISVGRGQMMFNVPYLADYVLREPQTDDNAALVRQWML